MEAASRKKATSEIDRKLPKDEDAINQVTTALTGMPKAYISTAISNMHTATGSILESLDPRFSIHTEYRNKTTSIQIHPKENVPLKLEITGQDADEFHDQYCRLIAHGTELKINSKDITFTGSKLIEELLSNIDGTFSVSSNNIASTQKIWLVEEKTGEFELLDDVQGNITFGTETFTFGGFALNELLEIRYQINRENFGDKFNFAFSINFEKWNDKSITNLAYFDKIFNLFSKLYDGWMLYTALEINGDRVFTSKGTKLDKWEYTSHTYSHLNYIKCCNIIAKALHVEIKYKFGITYSADDYKKIAAIAHNIEYGEIYSDKTQLEKFETQLVIDETRSIVKLLSEQPKTNNFHMWIDKQEKINIFNEVITLPPKAYNLESFLPIVNVQLEHLKCGDSIWVTWVPQQNSSVTINYLLPSKIQN